MLPSANARLLPAWRSWELFGFQGWKRERRSSRKRSPHPAAGSASSQQRCSSAPSQLLKSKRAFNKKPNPQTSLRAEQ